MGIGRTGFAFGGQGGLLWNWVDGGHTALLSGVAERLVEGFPLSSRIIWLVAVFPGSLVSLSLRLFFASAALILYSLSCPSERIPFCILFNSLLHFA